MFSQERSYYSFCCEAKVDHSPKSVGFLQSNSVRYINV